MADVFISYSTHDINRASAIRSLLEKNSITCWMGDKDIHASKTYTEEITKAIKNCHAFLLVLSSHAQESTYVLSEFECAISLRKTIVPIIIENFRINERFLFHIRRVQAIKAYEDWKEAQKELLNTIEYLLQNIQPKADKIDAIITQSVSDASNTVPNKPAYASNYSLPIEYAGEVVDMRYGKQRIPVKITPEGKYQILCKHCDSEQVNNLNYSRAKDMYELNSSLLKLFLSLASMACFVSLMFFAVEDLSKINKLILLTFANPLFWGTLISILIFRLSEEKDICNKKYVTKYTPDIDGHTCTQILYCKSCGKPFTVKIPLQDCHNYFFFDTELPGRIYEIGKNAPESIFKFRDPISTE